MTTPLTVRLEQLHTVKQRQAIWTDTHEKTTANMNPDDLVITHSRITPFGTYLLHLQREQQVHDAHINRVKQCEATDKTNGLDFASGETMDAWQEYEDYQNWVADQMDLLTSSSNR